MNEQILLEKAQKELVSDNNQEAFKLAKEVIRLNPENAKALLVAGYACELMNDADQAIEFYETALETAPSPEIVLQMRRCVESRAKHNASDSARAGDIVLPVDDTIEAVFTKRERAVYDKFISVEQGRRLTMVISQKPGDSKSITEPHFGGEPYAERGSTWPSCKSCSRAKNFVGQFAWDPSVNDASNKTWSTDWLVCLFHCFGCKPVKAEHSDIQLYKTPKQDSHVSISPPKDAKASYLVALEHYRYELKGPELIQKVQLLPGSDFIPNKYSRALEWKASGFEQPPERFEQKEPDRAFLGGFSNTVVTLDFSVRLEICYDKTTDSCKMVV